MADLKEARVPDIGHADVPVIEVLVKAGDRVEKEQSLITLESDKATMEVPAPFAGTVKEVKLKVGDEVSEGAVIALTKQIAVQWAADGIRCNSICPGTVDSPWVARLLDEAEDPVERRDQLVGRQPMGRLGTPDEIAEAAIYLASDAAAFMTGADLVIDGGITAG